MNNFNLLIFYLSHKNKINETDLKSAIWPILFSIFYKQSNPWKIILNVIEFYLKIFKKQVTG